jgi:hypothetical protein
MTRGIQGAIGPRALPDRKPLIDKAIGDVELQPVAIQLQSRSKSLQTAGREKVLLSFMGIAGAIIRKADSPEGRSEQ